MPAYALIVEPDQAQAQLYRHIALAEGLDPRLVRDGEQARLALEALGAPALTITELSVPRLDGFQIIERVRRLAGPEASPVLAISAFRNLRDAAVREKERLGIAALLAKSSPVESIRRTVKKMLLGSPTPRAPAPSTPPPEPVWTNAAGREIDEERAEEKRLQHLDEMEMVDAPGTSQDEELQRIVVDAARRFDVPIAFISLVTENRQFAKAWVGLEGRLLAERGSARDEAFCTHVVSAREPLVVPDAAVHPAFASNPLVQDGSVRSYAGAPLLTPSGHVLGSLCIIDKKPMSISADDVDELVLLARLVAGELELRSEQKRLLRERARLPEAMRRQLPDSKPLFSAVSYLSAVLDNIDNGALLMNPQRVVVFANRALAEMLGVTVESLVGRKREDVIQDVAQQSADGDDFLRRVRTHNEGPYSIRAEFELLRPSRRLLRWSSKPVQLAEGAGQLTVVTDITAEVDLQREREQLARTDVVTGLMNRRGAEEVLEREISRARRFGSRIAFALVDLDHFKQVNDRYGHAAGDETLRAVSQAAAATVRGVDVAARWGGDELLAILPNTGLDGARSFGERLRAAVEALDKDVLHGVTLSVGIAELEPGEDWPDALRRADARLYEAKEGGKNRVA